MTKLQIFDFDDTLFRVPSYTSKTQVEALGFRFSGPYEYYDHAISLDETLSNIQLISPVYDAWKNGKTDPECKQALITHRVEEVHESVNSILEARKIDFDHRFFLGRAIPKITATEAMMDEMPQLKDIEIYEDSVHQIIQYQEFFKKQNAGRIKAKLAPYVVKIYIVDKSKMYRIENLKLSEEKKIVLI